MTPKVIIEITSLVEVSFVSGIQRVVREILTRALTRRSTDVEFVLLRYDVHHKAFRQITPEDFLAVYRDRTDSHERIRSTPYRMENLGPDDLFLDIDSVWNNRFRRSFLLPILKSLGVRIAVMVYDIIPILFPEYCDGQTTVRFMDYIGAHLLYADLLLANTRSTLDDIDRLSDRIGTPRIPGACIPLGADFTAPRDHPAAVNLDAKTSAITQGKFLLCVGTIEPRKNHAFLLDTYIERLRDKGYGLIIAGRPGWNVENLTERLTGMNRSDASFAYLPAADDSTIAYLYQKAYFTVFPTEYEGYGLPIIESILRKTPVLASDIPVLREVGGTFCAYFATRDKDAFCDRLVQYEENPEAYEALRDHLAEYQPFTWDLSEDLLWETLRKTFFEKENRA